MKIKGFLIVGALFCVAGASSMIVGATKSDFNYGLINAEAVELTYENNYNKIVYNGNLDNLEIIYGDVEAINIISKKCDNMVYNIDTIDSVITINQNFEDSSWLTRVRGLKTYSMPFVITIPNGTKIDIEAKLDVGNIEIKDLKAEAIKLKVNAGNTSLENIEATNLNATVDAENLAIKNSVVYNLGVKVDAGNLDYGGKINTSADFEVSCGNLSIDLDQSKNSVAVNNSIEGKVIITYRCSCGHAEVNYTD